MMRVLHCIPSMWNGGAQRQLAYLAAQQIRNGARVDVALLYGGPNLPRLEAAGASVHWLKGSGNHDPRLLWQLSRLIGHIQPDIVQTWLNQMDLLGGLAARWHGVPWILSERSSSLAYPPTWKNGIRAALGRRATAIISNSIGGDTYWQTRVRPEVSRNVIPNAIPFAEITQATPLSRATLGLQNQEKLVLYVGRMSPEKNLQNLISAIKTAATQHSLVAWFCGDGTHIKATERLIVEGGLAHQIVLAGYRPDVWNLMKSADVFVSASTFEGEPNSVLEAAACGVPLVLSDIPAHRDIFSDDSVFFVDPLSASEIAAGIGRVLSAPAEAQFKARQAQATIGQRSVAEVSRRYAAVYQKLLSRQPASPPHGQRFDPGHAAGSGAVLTPLVAETGKTANRSGQLRRG